MKQRAEGRREEEEEEEEVSIEGCMEVVKNRCQVRSKMSYEKKKAIGGRGGRKEGTTEEKS